MSIAAPRKVLAVSIASLFATGMAVAQTQPAPAEESVGTVVVTGTRVSNRTVLDTAAPVDVISAESLKNSGVPEITQALSVALPSLNFPRPGLADGTDTIRPATLRGLAPDQTLVLVNSKRRHTSSLVNLNGTIGRGSAAVDMNTIPTAMVKSIEVLRDGASAQYGSDAIAGVVNVRLRDDRKGGEGTISYGKRDTEYEFSPVPGPAGATWDTSRQLAQAHRRRHLHRQRLERPGAGRRRLPDLRAGAQEPEAHRAQWLGHPCPVPTGERRVRSARKDHRPLQCLVWRA
ncbi:TonB-dependent receptor plug domain-containing protein [Pseudoduganella sp. UC29_106]|uniref:TonB-dependent receptor plug domain-containing protein n=1 Tax=Pseudoduganella sp. UC29_106 TaxID=3374553 RepID=UPI0037565574